MRGFGSFAAGFGLRAPRCAKMNSLSGVKASGVVVVEFEDAGEGRCRQSWSITTRSLSITSPSNSGVAVELEGEIFVKGARTYAFHAAQASFEKLDEPHGAVRVSGEVGGFPGEMNVEDLERGVTFGCEELTWMPELRSLILDRGVTAVIPSKLRVTCPKLTISAAESSGTLEETMATVSDQRCRGCLSSASLGSSAILHGPCQGRVQVPFGVPSIGGLATLSSRMQAARSQGPGGVELEFCADGILFDVKHNALMAQGPLLLSCFQNECKIGAGAGDILLGEGLVTLHDHVSTTMHGYELKAPNITWYYGRHKKAQGWHNPHSSKGLDLGKFALENCQMTTSVPTSDAQEGSLSRFKSKVGGMEARRQMLGKGLRTRSFWTACRSIAVGHSSLPRSISRPRKFDTSRSLCKTTVSMDSSGLRVELFQLLRCILEGCVVNFGVPLGTESSVRERNVYPVLAAREERASIARKLVSADVVASGPICLCKKTT